MQESLHSEVPHKELSRQILIIPRTGNPPCINDFTITKDGRLLIPMTMDKMFIEDEKMNKGTNAEQIEKCMLASSDL
jgi:hypothetical protein